MFVVSSMGSGFSRKQVFPPNRATVGFQEKHYRLKVPVFLPMAMFFSQYFQAILWGPRPCFCLALFLECGGTTPLFFSRKRSILKAKAASCHRTPKFGHFELQSHLTAAAMLRCAARGKRTRMK
jgi:hypothetical protein